LTVACGARPVRKIEVPPHYARTSCETPASPYVVKLADGGRTWEVAMPATQGGYQVRIPIGDGSPLIPERAVAAKTNTEPSTSSPAYLAGLTRVQALFKRDSYELALSEVVGLLKDYPNDTRLMSMQGTLLWKLGDKARAQAVWEEVARREPDNQTVLQMLEGVQ
jgi:hypothetical protein